MWAPTRRAVSQAVVPHSSHQTSVVVTYLCKRPEPTCNRLRVSCLFGVLRVPTSPSCGIVQIPMRTYRLFTISILNTSAEHRCLCDLEQMFSRTVRETPTSYRWICRSGRTTFWVPETT